MRSNRETDTNTLETQYRAKRGQNTLQVELGLVTRQNFDSNSVGSATGGGSGVGGASVVNSLTGGTSPGGASCPEIHQFILVRSELGTPIPTQVQYVEIGFYLWSPFTNTFEKVIKADEIEDVEIWHVTDGLASASGSASHPLIHIDNTKGTTLDKCQMGTSVPIFSHQDLFITQIAQVYKGGKGNVMHLETEGPTHLYCAGQSPTDMFVWHNLKPVPEDETV